jgi:hypothetical protein
MSQGLPDKMSNIKEEKQELEPQKLPNLSPKSPSSPITPTTTAAVANVSLNIGSESETKPNSQLTSTGSSSNSLLFGYVNLATNPPAMKKLEATDYTTFRDWKKAALNYFGQY